MRFLHIADLHLGKTLLGLPLLEDQADWVDRFVELTASLHPDAVVIAGDVYDRSQPAADAVALLDRLLTSLTDLSVPVLLIAGNHDSGTRLSFANELLARQGLHIAGGIGEKGEITHVTLHDEYGPVTFYLMPYVFPLLVSELLGYDEIRDYDTAVRRLLEIQPIDRNARNVLVAHQNVTVNGVESVRGGSETMVGGVGQVDYTCFDAFDYVALGHIHAAYPVGRETVRFAGSPLHYHFDELRQREKGPLLITMGEKGTGIQIETLHIPPLHPLGELSGTWAELCAQASSSEEKNRYMSVTVTDQVADSEKRSYLTGLYEARGGKLLSFTSSFSRDWNSDVSATSEAVQSRSIDRLFADFYTERTGGDSLDKQDLTLLSEAAALMETEDLHAMPSQEKIAQLLALLMHQTEEVENL